MRKALLVMAALVVAAISATDAGEGRAAEDAGLNIEELRAFQAYFYRMGNRDPLTMRFPTDRERGLESHGKPPPISLDEMRDKVDEWLAGTAKALRDLDYESALEISTAALRVIDGEWPSLKPDRDEELIRKIDDIRDYQHIAARLKNQREVEREFVELGIRVDGVAWSPVDAKAVINGKTYSAGDVLLKVRRAGDLSVEVIDEKGVSFQFKGIRFRLPVGESPATFALGGN